MDVSTGFWLSLVVSLLLGHLGSGTPRYRAAALSARLVRCSQRYDHFGLGLYVPREKLYYPKETL